MNMADGWPERKTETVKTVQVSIDAEWSRDGLRISRQP